MDPSADVSLPPDAASRPLQPEIRFVMDRFGVSAEEAVLRLRRQDAAALVEAAARRQLGVDFAGVWTDIGRDVILVASVSGPVDLSALDENSMLRGHVEQRKVVNSLAVLEGVQSDLVERTAGSMLVRVDGVDLPSNRVVVDTVADAHATGADRVLLDYIDECTDTVSVRVVDRLVVGRKL